MLFGDFDCYRLGDSRLSFPFACDLVDRENLDVLEQNGQRSASHGPETDEVDALLEVENCGSLPLARLLQFPRHL